MATTTWKTWQSMCTGKSWMILLTFVHSSEAYAFQANDFSATQSKRCWSLLWVLIKYDHNKETIHMQQCLFASEKFGLGWKSLHYFLSRDFFSRKIQGNSFFWNQELVSVNFLLYNLQYVFFGQEVSL